jgi:hypothetical protein
VISIGYEIFTGQWGSIFWVAVFWGVVLFIWQVICDVGNAVADRVSQPQVHLHEHREISVKESPDPTRPHVSEDYPAIIEITKRHYKIR